MDRSSTQEIELPGGTAMVVRPVAEADVRKLIHDPFELFTRMVQPVLWLLIFGQVFNRTRAIPTGGLRYLDFMAPGILAQSVLFSSIFYGISLIWERDLGIVQKFLVSPAPRSTLVLGRAISSTVRTVKSSSSGFWILWRPRMSWVMATARGSTWSDRDAAIDTWWR